MESGGIPYFPLDCQLDGKFELIEAEFGLNGFAVIVKIFQRIYGVEGYYTQWTKEVALVFAHKVGLGASAVSEIVSASIRRGIFDQRLYEQYQILTSKGIQDRYFKAAKRRKGLCVNGAYLLINAAQISDHVDIFAENVSRNAKNACKNGQRREEKRRGEKRREDSMRALSTGEAAPKISLILNDGSLYPIYQEQIDKWIALYPSVDVLQELRNMAGWLDANKTRRKTRSGIERFINNWLAREQNKGGTKNGNGNNGEFVPSRPGNIQF